MTKNIVTVLSEKAFDQETKLDPDAYDSTAKLKECGKDVEPNEQILQARVESSFFLRWNVCNFNIVYCATQTLRANWRRDLHQCLPRIS